MRLKHASACTLAGELCFRNSTKNCGALRHIRSERAQQAYATGHILHSKTWTPEQAFLKIERLDCSADTQNYPALDAERLHSRSAHGTHLIAGEVLNGMTNLLPSST